MELIIPFPLPYKFAEFAATLTGQPLSIGIDFSADPNDYDALHNRDEKVLKFKPADVPSDGAGLVVSGLPILPLIVKVESPTDISAMLSMEGVDGDYEYLINDETITSKQAARDRAQAEILAYGNTLSEGEFVTEVDGLVSGQIINIDVTDLGISENFIINRVETTSFADTTLRYKVSLISTKTKDMIGVLQQLLLNNTKIVVRENEIIDLIKTAFETINMTDSATASKVHNTQAESMAINETLSATIDYPIRFILSGEPPSGSDRAFMIDGSPIGTV